MPARNRAWRGCSSAYLTTKPQDLRRCFCASSSKELFSMRVLPSQEQIARSAGRPGRCVPDRRGEERGVVPCARVPVRTFSARAYQSGRAKSGWRCTSRRGAACSGRAASCSATRAGDGADKTRRKPRLLLRLSGSFLLRFETRVLLSLLFQLPPRFTRLRPSVAAPLHWTASASASHQSCGQCRPGFPMRIAAAEP